MSALFIRRRPIDAMVGGQTYVCVGIRTGIIPPLLFAQRYELTQAQIDQRAARPPAINAFHPTRKSATDMGLDLAKRIFGKLKGAKVSTMLGQPEPIQPLADVIMTEPDDTEDVPVPEPMEGAGDDVTMIAPATMSGGPSPYIDQDAPTRSIPKPVAWDTPQTCTTGRCYCTKYVGADIPPTTTTSHGGRKNRCRFSKNEYADAANTGITGGLLPQRVATIEAPTGRTNTTDSTRWSDLGTSTSWRSRNRRQIEECRISWPCTSYGKSGRPPGGRQDMPMWTLAAQDTKWMRMRTILLLAS
jgi:hypothetical protein